MAALTRLQSIEKLKWMCSADTYPELSNSELGELIDEHKRSDDWTASTAYIVGDRIQPTVKNGRIYECVIAGTTSTNPDIFPNIGYTNQVISEGVDLVWRDVGAAYYETYDVRSAAREGWMMKASKIAHLIDVEDGQQKLNFSKLLEHCYKMAEKYRPIGIY